MHDFAPSVAVASSDSAADGTATDGSANPDTSTTDPANPGTSTKGDHTKQNPWNIFDPYSEQNAPTAISLNATSKQIGVGGETYLDASLTPKSSRTVITWSSSDQSVATVTRSGIVRGVAAGTATITAMSASGVSDSVTGFCPPAGATRASAGTAYSRSPGLAPPRPGPSPITM